MHPPTRPISQTSRLRTSKPPDWWLSYFHTHPIQTIFAVTSTCGGLLLLPFFVQLHAMPDLDLAGASALLLAVAVVGAVLAFFLTACAFGGGWVLRNSGPEAEALRQGRSAWLLLVPSLVIAVAIFCTDGSPLYIYGPLAMAVTVAASLHVRWLPQKEKANWKTRTSHALTYAYLSLMCFMVAALAFISFVALAASNPQTEYVEARLGMWVAWCLICNFVMSRPETAKLSAQLGACVVSIVILILLSNNGMALPKAVVRSLGLGELPVALVVTEAGCQHLNQASGQVVCQVQPNERSALVCPALLRSRIGSPYFIGLSPYTAQGAWPADALPARTATVALPKSEVLSWSRIEPKPAEKLTSDSAPHSAKPSMAQSAVLTRWSADLHDAWLHAQCDFPK